MQRIGKHLTYANVVATIALLVVVLLTPASAHVGRSFRHLWREHVSPKVATHLKDYSVSSFEPVEVVAGDTVTLDAECPVGKALSGGFEQPDDAADVALVESYPNVGQPRTWSIGVRNDGADNATVLLYVVCAKVRH
jgi:hypothetical protein